MRYDVIMKYTVSEGQQVQERSSQKYVKPLNMLLGHVVSISLHVYFVILAFAISLQPHSQHYVVFQHDLHQLIRPPRDQARQPCLRPSVSSKKASQLLALEYMVPCPSFMMRRLAYQSCVRLQECRVVLLKADSPQHSRELRPVGKVLGSLAADSQGTDRMSGSCCDTLR